ncbi:hypothetical protein [Sinorhizobium alkalisoli]|uniref:hypothetical protein n=1 Tax=Sinorhizobium alkalisoli TaxID=1752398 RepID=UPI0010423373|nr:hypothetical protein [Sinorhizobium alkalisoli]MCA1492280.1 hypothetical protein [Ensifer sp. NBAIM29]QFI66383.1 hypothetical protein EKH55_1509 [Sinorhizobium alkalisoli]
MTPILSPGKEMGDLNHSGKDQLMRAIILLMALVILGACSQTGSPTVYHHYQPGQGEYYTGIVPPTPI